MRAEVVIKRLPVAAIVVLLLTIVSTGCRSAHDTIRIGVFGDCHGPFSANHEQEVAGAELPFIRRGATRRGSTPSDGVESVMVGGKRVELVIGCDFFGSSVAVLAAERRLVEQQGVDILVTPSSPADGLVLPQYPPHQPGVAFISTGLSPAPPQQNVFRVAQDLREGSAGLGAYAYHTLGWRTAVTVGEDDPIGWPLTAGFVAEFCSLGGTIVKRSWAPAVITDWSSHVRQIPHGVDGVALMAAQNTTSFFAAYKRLQPDLSRHVVMSAASIANALFTGRRPPVGIMAAGFLPFESSAPAWTRYLHDLRAAFPEHRGRFGAPEDVYSYDAVELALEAIERAHGDLSDGERRFMAALTTVRIQTPVGPLQLDRDRHVIAPNLLIRVEKDAGGKLIPRTVGVVPNVEETYNGYFTASSPPDGRTQPVCRKGNPPSWAR